MRTVKYERPVYYYETDRMDCVHHSNYIRWFEEARIHFMRVCGMSLEGLEAGGIVSPVLHAEAEYRSMARFGETVEIETGIESYTGTRIAFFYTVRDKETGALRCEGKTSHCFLNDTGRPVSLKKANPAYDLVVRRIWQETEKENTKQNKEKGKTASVCKKIFPMEEISEYKYVVIFSRYRGKLLLSRHKARATWETQGGHIEPGETPEQAARRELWEESGAGEFTLEPVCGYYAEDETSGAAGAVFFAEITELAALPESEMKEVGCFDALPENVTYPGITPALFEKVKAKFC